MNIKKYLAFQCLTSDWPVLSKCLEQDKEGSQQIMVFSTMPDDLNSTPRTYMVEKEKLLQMVVWPVHMYLDRKTRTYIWMNE